MENPDSPLPPSSVTVRQTEHNGRKRPATPHPDDYFRAFVTASSDVVYRMNPDWTEMRYLSSRDFIADTENATRGWLEKYIHPDDQNAVRAAIEKAIQTKTPFELEHRVIRVDGTLGWTFSRAVPVLDVDGEIIEWVGAARDVTMRKESEQTLSSLIAQSEQQRRFYDTILSTTPDLVYVFDLNHRFIYANKALLTMWGKTWDEAIGKNCLELGYEPWHAAMHDREIEQVIATKQPVRGDVPFTGTHGRRIYDYIFVPVIGANGNVEVVAGTTRDVTDRKQVEEDLRRANEDLEQFAYTATHDLQEPLRGVSIYSELLTKRYAEKLDGQALDFLKFLRSSALRMEMLVHDLLAYTQVSRIDTSAATTDASACLQAALANLASAIAETGAHIFFDPLPSVRVHSIHLQQIFQNLIGNAIKYHHPDRPPVIEIRATGQNGSCLFSVRDNGIGIEPQYQERIFGLFKRLHTGDKYPGTGIGLSICQRIVERYHGRIWVESEPGSGATFHFTLPC